MEGLNRKQLIKQAKKGNVDAFATVFEELRPFVFSVAYRLTGTNDADDVVLETYLKAWKALPRFNEKATLKTWLFRITHNCARDFIRKRVRHESRFIHQADESKDIVNEIADTTQQSPAGNLEKSETSDIMTQALNMLPDEHKVTLLLRYTDDLSYSEIAAATGVSIGTVMSRLFNGKRKLKKALKTLDKDNIYSM